LDWLLAALLSLAAYLVGSIPTAYILVRRVRGLDIRRVGSRNVGALNTFQQVGLWGGLLVLLFDAGKGALAVLAPGWISGAPQWTVYSTAILVVIGHNWPVFLGFRGGKGAASILGVSLALLPVLTLIAAGSTLLIVLLLRNVVIGALVGFILLDALTVITHQEAGLIALCFFLTSLVTASYLGSDRKRLSAAIKARQWRALFYGVRPTPEE
jgi:glycerol-3-phosphate acyltransferase PlsY